MQVAIIGKIEKIAKLSEPKKEYSSPMKNPVKPTFTKTIVKASIKIIKIYSVLIFFAIELYEKILLIFTKYIGSINSHTTSLIAPINTSF